MKNFDVKSFIENDGLQMLNEGYSETEKGCALTICAQANDVQNSETFLYTFWLFKMPTASEKRFDIWLSCFQRQRLSN